MGIFKQIKHTALKRTSQEKTFEPKETEFSNNIYSIGDTIAIPQNGANLIYFKGNVKYDFLGNMARLLFQPPQLWCEIRYENGEIEYWRIPPTILKAGILVNIKSTNQSDFYNLAKYKGARNLKVKNIRFVTKYFRNNFGFENKFSGSFSAMSY
jgi:hypothetical protein